MFESIQKSADADEATSLRRLAQRGGRNSAAIFGGGVLLVVVIVAIAAPLIAPYDPYEIELSKRLIPPLFSEDADLIHPLGTDGFGRDYLSRLIYGARISLLIGISVMLISGAIGTSLGLVAGYFGGRVDQVIMFVINTRLALPVFLVAMAVAVVFGASLWGTVVTLGVLMWERFAIVVRSTTQQAVGQDYVTAAKSIGCSHFYIMVREILPNVMNAVVVVGTIEIAYAILLEAALSFLGFGVQEPTPSWGLMLAQAREHLFFDAWLLYIPGMALFVVVLSINLFGDGLRDLLGLERHR